LTGTSLTAIAARGGVTSRQWRYDVVILVVVTAGLMLLRNERSREGWLSIRVAAEV